MKRARASLLNKALAKPPCISQRGETPTAEEIELALAWLQGKVRLTQVEHALEKSNVLHRLSLYLRAAYDDGRLVVRGPK